MRRLVCGLITSLLLLVVACSSGAGGGFCNALVASCDSSAKTCTRLLDADALDHPSCVDKRDAFLGCLANQKLACPDSSTVYAGAGAAGAKFSLSGFTAYTNASCVKLGDAWVACRDAKPPCTAVDVGASQKFVLSPSMPTATAPKAKIVAPGSGNHSWDTKYDVDLTAFLGAGTLTISGVLGATGTDGSFDLFPSCQALPVTGSNTGVLASADNTPAGATWTVTYSFDRGAVYHFGAEGNWDSTQGQTNTTSVEISVTQP